MLLQMKQQSNAGKSKLNTWYSRSGFSLIPSHNIWGGRNNFGQIMNEFSNLCPFHCCSNSVRHTGTVRKYKKSSLSAGSTTAQAIEDNRKSQYSTLSMLTGFWMVCLQPLIVELQFSNSAGLMIKCNACSISHMTNHRIFGVIFSFLTETI